MTGHAGDVLRRVLRRLLLDRARQQAAGAADPRVEPAVVPRRPGEDDEAYLRRLAGQHLEPDVAQRWLGLLRPAVRLVAAGPEQAAVARLGGDPLVPAGFAWPVWDGHGPLGYVGEIDLAALARTGLPLDIAVPTAGRLLLFYFDGSYDDFEGIVGTWDTSTLAGQRLVHLTEDAGTCAPLSAPQDVLRYRERRLAAAPVLTFPTWEHPALRAALLGADCDSRSLLDHPVDVGDFARSCWAMHSGTPSHQIGGWALPVQGPVELEVAGAALDLGDDWVDPGRAVEARRWTTLVQIDSDDDMLWGDVGTLYWLARYDDLAVGDLTRVSFTWQCG